MRLPSSARYKAAMPRIVLAFLVCLAACSSALAAEPVFPPGSRIGLVPPPGMTPSASFQGFEDRARGAMLVVTELSAQSYGKVEQDFSPGQMATGGMEVLLREHVEIPSGKGLLVVTELSAQSNGKVEQDFSPGQMATGGMEVLLREHVEIPSGKGLLVVAQQH